MKLSHFNSVKIGQNDDFNNKKMRVLSTKQVTEYVEGKMDCVTNGHSLGGHLKSRSNCSSGTHKLESSNIKIQSIALAMTSFPLI